MLSARGRVSYAWALHTDASRRPLYQLSENAAEGLEYARELAQAARRRSEQALRHELLEPPLTVAQLAQDYDCTTRLISSRIARARRELFDQISDAAIYKRLQRHPKGRTKPVRPCNQQGCQSQLPTQAPGQRRYCDQHRTVAARVARHRDNEQTAAKRPAT